MGFFASLTASTDRRIVADRRAGNAPRGAVSEFAPVSAPAATVNFIVLGHPRCGSNLLTSALAQHPEVRMLNEILSDSEETRRGGWSHFGAVSADQAQSQSYRPGEDGAEFLDSRVFARLPQDGHRAFGFKHFYDHARFSPAVQTAWKYLATHDVRVIHIVRRNLFEVFISEAVAIRTSRWVRPAGDTSEPSTLPPFEIDPMQLWTYFERITSAREWSSLVFANHRVIEVEYEAELSADFPRVVDRVFGFLDLPPHPVQQRLARQRVLSPAEQISNYDQLKQGLTGTKFAQFFA